MHCTKLKHNCSPWKKDHGKCPAQDQNWKILLPFCLDLALGYSLKASGNFKEATKSEKWNKY